MKDDKKKGLAALIIAKGKPMEKEEDEGQDGCAMAVEDMMTAIKEDDAEMFRSALDAYLDMRD